MILELPSDRRWHRKEEALAFLSILAVRISSGPSDTKRNSNCTVTPLIYEGTVLSNPVCNALINFLLLIYVTSIKYKASFDA